MWEVMQQFELPIRKCSVPCLVEVSKYEKNAAERCLVRMEWFNGNMNTRKPHKKLMVAVASLQESREERKDAVMITGEGWCLCPFQPVSCFHVQVRTATPALE